MENEFINKFDTFLIIIFLSLIFFFFIIVSLASRIYSLEQLHKKEYCLECETIVEKK